MAGKTFSLIKQNCQHERHRTYAERTFDILNGFEIIALKCSNCHRTIELTIRKLTQRPNNTIRE